MPASWQVEPAWPAASGDTTIGGPIQRGAFDGGSAMPQWVRRLICAACLTALPGCADIFNHNWLAPPGPAAYQLAVAKKYDPFPDPTIAPEIMGGRPLGFMNPRPEPDVTKNMRLWPASSTGGTQAPYYVPATATPSTAAPSIAAPAYVGPAYTAPSFSAPRATYPPPAGYAAPAVVAPPLYSPPPSAPASNVPPLVPLGP